MSEYLRERYNQWAQASLAGGLVLYYIGVFAAYKLYDLISYPTAFACFVLITVAACIFALWHDSKVIAYLALLGGFFSVSYTFDFVTTAQMLTFFFILVAAALCLALIKRWQALALWHLYLCSCSNYHQVSHFWKAIPSTCILSLK